MTGPDPFPDDGTTDQVDTVITDRSSPGEERSIETRVRYRIGPEIGRGGMGRVHAAADLAAGREVAVKTLARDRGAAEVDRFVHEARLTASLQHPNIVPVHALGRTAAGEPWLAMKRVRGRTLAEVVASRPFGPLDEAWIDQVLSLFEKVLDAVAYAHSRGILHRDLKPDNVMVGEFGEVLVMDWGIAGAIDGTRRETGERTPETPGSARDGEGVAGTPEYMSPEQARGEALDARSDVFALGGVLHFLLTGRSLYDGRDVPTTLAAARKGRISSPRQAAPHARIPAGLDAIVRKATARRAGDRYRTAGALAADVAAFRSLRPTSAQRPGPVARAILALRRRPAAGAVAAAVLLLATAAAVAAGRVLAARAEDDRRDAEAARREAEGVEAARRLEAEAREAERRELVRTGGVEALRRALAVGGDERRREFARELDAAFGRLEARGRDGDEERILAGLGAEGAARILADLERLRAARDERGVEMEAGDFYFLGRLHERLRGDPAGAALRFEAGLELFPDDVALLASAAAARARAGLDLGPARSEVERAVRLAPDRSEVRLARALVRLESRDAGGALADVSAAIATGEAGARGLALRAAVRFVSDDPGAARADLEAALALDPPPGVRRELADVFRRAAGRDRREGRVDRALAGVESALRLDAGHAGALGLRGRLRVDAGAVEAGLADLDRALTIDPAHVEARADRVLAHAARGDWQRAAADADRLVAGAPDRAIGWLLRVRVLVETGGLSLVRADLETALARLGTDPDPDAAAMAPGVLVRLAAALHANGQAEAALGHVEKALELGATAAARVLGGRILGDLGRWDAAAEELERALREAPEDPGAMAALAWLLAACPEAARRDGARAVGLAAAAHGRPDLEPAVRTRAAEALAAALAEAGRFAEAVEVQEGLVRSAPQVDAYRARLDLYRSGRPYRAGPG